MDTSEIFNCQQSQNSSVPLGSSGFADRQKMLFDQLEVAELRSQSKLLPNDPYSPMEVDLISATSKKRKRTETKQFRGKESIFKRPDVPISKCLPSKSRPGYQLNPNKWVKYSLEDVTPEDISNRSNTAAALSFLREIEERKEKDAESAVADSEQKIIFKKRHVKLPPTFNTSSIISSTITAESTDKPCFKSSKLIMPEYVVGQKKPKEKRTKPSKIEKGKQLKLDHLLEEIDE